MRAPTIIIPTELDNTLVPGLSCHVLIISQFGHYQDGFFGNSPVLKPKQCS